jgi:pimeloyl-ACP methyl ester carboxylesterase
VAVVASLAIGASSAAAQVKKVPRPKSITLTTKDGVRLGATYYASNMGKDAVPIVMLHDLKETRAVFNSVAEALQNPTGRAGQSHAVLTVDLRGHGHSKTIVDEYGATQQIDSALLRQVDFENMVLFDMEAVRAFLVDQNDAGALNLNKLCVIGSGMGANIAVIWTARDWAMPVLANRKQGQDIKGLVLLSPRWNYRGLPLNNALQQPGLEHKVSFLVVYGADDPRMKRDAENIVRNLKKVRPEPPPDRVREEQDVFEVGLATKLQGTKLLTAREFDLFPIVDQFIDARLTQQSYPWVGPRTPP